MFKKLVENNFQLYKDQIVVKRATERNLEIIGEATKKLVSVDSNIKVASAKQIVSLRNLIAHAYDSIEDELIWGIIQKDIPKLSEETQKLKRGA